MIRKLKTRLRVGGIVAAAVLAAAALVPWHGVQMVAKSQTERYLVQAQVDGLRKVESLLVDAETGQRGFIITGNDEFLRPYVRAVAALPIALAEQERRYVPEPEVVRSIVADIEGNVRLKLFELERTILERREHGLAAVQVTVSAGAGKRYMDEVRRLSEDLASRGQTQLVALDQELGSKIGWATALFVLSTVLSISLFGLLARTLWQAVLQRERFSEETTQANLRLEKGMLDLERHNVEMAALSEMARVLQTEMNLQEALKVTAVFCARLLAGTQGAIYLFRNSADIVERAAIWGNDAVDAAFTLEPKSCWGLRLGQAHCCDDLNHLRCTHDRSEAWHVCIPLMAYGEVQGLLEFGPLNESAPTAAQAKAKAQLIGEQVALSLSNVKLREVLRDQSIKDPLTGLFNRRYMADTLARELARASRQQTSLSVVMVDLDHFKNVNDMYGHPAGDAVLKKAGQFFAATMRESDIACRHGGEEFILILPDCDRDAAIAKAQNLCEGMRLLYFSDAAAGLQITASFGVAAFPENAREAQELVAAADAALYLAKKSGRNKVVVSDSAMHSI